jgi:cytochrome P450
MQAITLDVIMAAIFGIEGTPKIGTPEHGLRLATKELVAASTWRVAQIAELMNIGRDEPVGFTPAALAVLDGQAYAVIAARRGTDLEGRHDILSLLLQARTKDGEALTDRELRDELLTLVLAGHETTANSLAWTWERLVRHPDAYDHLRSAVRDDEDGDAEIEAAINEGMRCRPVIPMVGRRVTVPWQLGDYGVPAGTPIAISILLLHHRDDIYEDPFAFRPERWQGHQPGTYEWIPFGGGIRRCLGTALAMAEQRVVMRAMVERLDLEPAEPEPEHAVHRNVTMIPGRAGAWLCGRSSEARVGLLHSLDVAAGVDRSLRGVLERGRQREVDLRGPQRVSRDRDGVAQVALELDPRVPLDCLRTPVTQERQRNRSAPDRDRLQRR